MPMTLPGNLTFSQASLQDYADCPYRFQSRYVLGVLWPAAHGLDLEWEHRAELGAAFHQLVHRHTLGLPADVLASTASGGDIARWWQAYLTQPPRGLPAGTRRSEVRLSTPRGTCRLVARYDLLAVEPGKKAVIVDWKTSQVRPPRAWLEERWQTLVYRYVLAEAGTQLNGGSPFRPEQIELVYWFANYPQQVERFPYDAAQHERAGAALDSLVAEIAAREEQEWPLAPDPAHCQYCTYRTLCGRETGKGAPHDEPEADLSDLDIDLEQIAEIEF
jgi:CRISPR/Cas system-associated exonuclease Cas4 (RecB family)